MIEVDCQHSECGRTKDIHQTISRDGISVSMMNNPEERWEITVVTDGTGTFIYEAYCHEHRLSDSVDAVMESAMRMTEKFDEAAKVADEIYEEIEV